MANRQPKPITIDFETFGIDGRPTYPPAPCGVSIKVFGRKPVYYAFGHITKNNCSWFDARKALLDVWDHKDGLLFQNGKFDIDVANVHMDLPIPHWSKIHDTMFLLFLDDPHQTNLSLKPSAERLLGMSPEERDVVGDWFITNQPIPDIKVSLSQKSDNYFMKYLPHCPGDIVGPYANGDVIRTEKLFKLLFPKTSARQMIGAYDRERELMPILLEMERNGIQLDHARLKADVEEFNSIRDKLTTWIIKRLKADPGINLNSPKELVDAMLASGCADPDKMLRTPTGKFKISKDALLVGVTDKVLLAVLTYLTQLNTCLNTFMQPWLLVANKSGGKIFTTWNQTKMPAKGGVVGTRTGRLSSTPNFQNIPLIFGAIFHHDDKKKKLPKCPIKDLRALPNIRSYITPFKSEVLIDRDYSQQEPRILAHFDGGALLEKYIENPWVDFHDYAKEELEKVGKFYERKPVKNTNLGLIYGMGAAALAIRNDMTVDESKELKKAIGALYPGLRDMYKDMRQRARTGIPIRTWGGREYYCEPPRLVKGRMMEFDYKLVNVLIQGSAADCTKEAIIRFHRVKETTWRIILNVHDQITVSVPKCDVVKSMELLRVCMESVEFDVSMLSEGDTSKTNWSELKTYDKKGVLV